MSDATIRYELSGLGWATLGLAVAGARVEVGEFGYCTDALGDLVRAALAIAASASSAEVRLDGEDDEWRLVLRRERDFEPHLADVRLRVLAFDQFGSHRPEEEGTLLFEAVMPPDAFPAAVLRAAREVWDRYGPAAYEESWGAFFGFCFPLRAMRALEAALSLDEPCSPTED